MGGKESLTARIPGVYQSDINSIIVIAAQAHVRQLNKNG
jgi:hypothetical protein